MNNLLDKIQLFKPKQNSFDLSHEKKLSANMGGLYPILLQDVIPGDKFKVNSELLIRMAPMISPVMHRITATTHYFFVPNRIVWDEWEEFITGGEDGQQQPVFPTINITGTRESTFELGTLSDYFGIPVTDVAKPITQSTKVSALPFRAYQTIFNEYYRDQNLTPANLVEKTSGDVQTLELISITELRTRAWEKDYFTSALPWAQRGGDVNLPVNSTFTPQYLTSTKATSLGSPSPNGDLFTGSGFLALTSSTGTGVNIENLADPQQVDSTSVTINELRKATALQRWLEKSARGGSRYAEQLLSFWGVRSSDARLQRPEYLGGGQNNISISETLSTVPTAVSATDPQGALGTMGGHGISMGKSNSFSRRFEEHGHIIGILSILPRTGYQQGLEKHWSKTDKFDYPWPEFAQLGEQTLENKELYMDYEGTQGQAEETFGYQSRYSEYKFKQNSTAGDMRGNLQFWHLNRIFTSPPALNTEFVTSNPDTRIWPVDLPSTDHLYIQLYNKVHVMRSLPYFNNPTIR